jgi:hypothetical protein
VDDADDDEEEDDDQFSSIVVAVVMMTNMSTGGHTDRTCLSWERENQFSQISRKEKSNYSNERVSLSFTSSQISVLDAPMILSAAMVKVHELSKAW